MNCAKSLQQQTATSEVLEVISSSPGELEPVFKKILENATRICDAKFGICSLKNGGRFRAVALYKMPPALRRIDWPRSGHASTARRSAHTGSRGQNNLFRRPTSGTNRLIFVGIEPAVRLADVGGARSSSVCPCLRRVNWLALLAIYRQEVRPFSERQIELVPNFATRPSSQSRNAAAQRAA